MTSSWPSGAVVKVLACHAGGREFESPLEQNFFFFFFFFFFFLKKDIFFLFSPSNLFFALVYFSFSNLFFALVYFSFSYLHNLDFFFQIDLHVISFSNLYKLNNLLISQLLILSMNYC